MDQLHIGQALNCLASVDADIARALPHTGVPAPRQRASGFAALLAIIIGQQVSTEAAAAIRGRVETVLAEVTAERLLETDDQVLRDAGMSWRKIEYANGLARSVLTNSLDLQALAHMPDADAIKAISSLRGFGRWSAGIYLMVFLKGSEIFSADYFALLVDRWRLNRVGAITTPKQERNMG